MVGVRTSYYNAKRGSYANHPTKEFPTSKAASLSLWRCTELDSDYSATYCPIRSQQKPQISLSTRRDKRSSILVKKEKNMNAKRVVLALALATLGTVLISHLSPPRAAIEIGRASCRERV